jgi:CYTH domain-containing protein
MKIERTFLIAPALVRLLQRERMVSREIVEGYLSRTPERLYFVRVEPDNCNLLLVVNADGARTEDRAKVSGAQAQAFLDACRGRITYRRNLVRIGLGLDVYLDRFERLDLVSVQFDDATTASAFVVPAWFGPEVTEDPAYQKSSLALDGMPETGEVPVSNAAIIAFLDCLEATTVIAPAAAVTPNDAASSDERMSDVLAGVSNALGSTASARWPTVRRWVDVKSEGGKRTHCGVS